VEEGKVQSSGLTALRMRRAMTLVGVGEIRDGHPDETAYFYFNTTCTLRSFPELRLPLW
jgi:hypothetical protein